MVSKNCYRKWKRPVLAAILFVPLLSQKTPAQQTPSQNTKQYLTLRELPKVAGKRSAAVPVKIPITVQMGYHVNSNAPKDQYLIPLKLTWKSTGALEGGQITYPKPALEKYEFAENPLSVYTGAFELVANFKVAANAPAGPGVAVGQLRYQACNDRACFPPKTLEISLPYQVQ